MGKFRDGMPVTTEAVTFVLSTVDRIKTILGEIEAHQREPTGNDGDLIEQLSRLAQFEGMPPPASSRGGECKAAAGFSRGGECKAAAGFSRGGECKAAAGSRARGCEAANAGARQSSCPSGSTMNAARGLRAIRSASMSRRSMTS